MSDRKHDPWELAKPIVIDGEDEEAVRPCDLIVCPECLAVRYIGGAQPEERVRTPASFMRGAVMVRGVFCPGCGQLLFDEESWIEHRTRRALYDQRRADDEQGRAEEEQRQAEKEERREDEARRPDAWEPEHAPRAEELAQEPPRSPGRRTKKALA